MTEARSEITVDDARSWVGFKLDDMGGASAGKVEAVLVDAEDGAPTWIVVRLGRFGRRPVDQFAEVGWLTSRAWVAHCLYPDAP